MHGPGCGGLPSGTRSGCDSIKQFNMQAVHDLRGVTLTVACSCSRQQSVHRYQPTWGHAGPSITNPPPCGENRGRAHMHTYAYVESPAAVAAESPHHRPELE